MLMGTLRWLIRWIAFAIGWMEEKVRRKQRVFVTVLCGGFCGNGSKPTELKERRSFEPGSRYRRMFEFVSAARGAGHRKKAQCISLAQRRKKESKSQFLT
jgi:hypothetical protein